MCLILDANVAHKFKEPPHKDMRPVVSWLLSRKYVNRAVTGGKLRKELDRAGTLFNRFLARLKRNGRLLEIADELVDAEESAVQQLLDEAEIPADDPHILALARVSGSRLLVSHDFRSGLHALFKDDRFVDPPGSIYQKRSHRHLLKKAPPCPG